MPYKDPEKAKARGKAYQEAHREERRAYTKEYQRRPKTKAQQLLYRRRPTSRATKGAYDRFYHYGIAPEAFETMLTGQGNVCAACGTANWGRGPAVDHDHETGDIRGILCVGCNLAAGWLGDDPERATKLSAYLRRVRSQ